MASAVVWIGGVQLGGLHLEVFKGGVHYRRHWFVLRHGSAAAMQTWPLMGTGQAAKWWGGGEPTGPKLAGLWVAEMTGACQAM